MSWYGLLKYVHVRLAITAAGSNLTYGVWQGAIVSRAPEHEGFAQRHWVTAGIMPIILAIAFMIVVKPSLGGTP